MNNNAWDISASHFSCTPSPLVSYSTSCWEECVSLCMLCLNSLPARDSVLESCFYFYHPSKINLVSPLLAVPKWSLWATAVFPYCVHMLKDETQCRFNARMVESCSDPHESFLCLAFLYHCEFPQYCAVLLNTGRYNNIIQIFQGIIWIFGASFSHGYAFDLLS